MTEGLRVEYPLQPPRQLGRKRQDHRERPMHEANAFDFADRISCQHRDAGRREPPEGLTFPFEISL
jgi:hypothetical protein